MSKYKDIEKEIRSYIKSRTTVDLVDGKATVIVKMPVEVGKRVFDISELPTLADFPSLPERQRDFAFRYGTEYKTQEEWADIFGVSRPTIQRWISKPEVAQVVALTKFELRAYNYGFMIRLQRKMYTKLDEFLDVKLTSTTMDSVLNAIKFIKSEILGTGGGVSSREKGSINVSIGMSSDERYGDQVDAPSPLRAERDVTPKDLAKIELDIERASAILRYTSGDNGDGVDDGDNGDSQ